MYRKLANHCTRYFIDKNIIDAQKQAIYLYGFEILISTTVYFLIFLLISILSHTVVASFIFWLGLFLLRKTAGGHHSNTYISCHLLFAANHVLCILLLNLIPTTYFKGLSIIFLCLSLLAVFFLAPIDHKNKPFIKNEYRKFKLLSRIYCLLLLGLLLIAVFLCKELGVNWFGFSFGTVSAATSLLIGKIIRSFERKEK